MIVSVDLGNKNIKTPELLFLTGLDSYDSNPSTTFFRNDCIQYEGKYYTVGSHRIEYTRYKHTDDRFFILTLMAIAKEIKRRGLKAIITKLSYFSAFHRLIIVLSMKI